MTFAELGKTETTYCKISKSCPEIATRCVEPHYKNYARQQVVEGSQLSFIPQDRILTALMYGDTYTEFDFSKRQETKMMQNDDIQFIGGGLDEYRAKRLFVKDSWSLDSEWTTYKMVENAKTIDPGIVLQSFKEQTKVYQHYKALNMTQGIKTWEMLANIYQQSKNNGKSMQEAIRAVKDHAAQKLQEMEKPQAIGGPKKLTLHFPAWRGKIREKRKERETEIQR